MHTRTSLLLACLLPAIALAQQPVDIGLHRASDGNQQVLLIPGEDFNGLLSALVFTLAWDANDPTTEPTLDQSPEQAAMLPLAPSGPAFTVGNVTYRRYAGIGMTPLREMGSLMQAGKSLSIAQVIAPPTGPVWIADGSWLKERRVNGAYYLSLNGVDRTGHVHTAIASEAPTDQGAFTVSPNPYNGGDLVYSFTSPETGTAELKLTDNQGRTIGAWRIQVTQGTVRGILSPPVLAAGSYTLQLILAQKETAVPLLVAGR